MANDHAKDRYDPPSTGSEYEEIQFSEINPGVIFRLFPYSDSKQYRKSNDHFAFDIKEHNNKLSKSDDKDDRFMASYPFNVDNVKGFIRFLKESGGFDIC